MILNDVDFDENIEKIEIETIKRFAKSSSNEIIKKKTRRTKLELKLKIEIENVCF